MLFKNNDGRPDLPKIEEKVLEFWKSSDIFQKSIDQNAHFKPYSFYDGPPFATGLPHYGHILASTIKDSVARFWTMRGRKVERRVGWDCHGLPVENLIEKELGLKDKRAILELGVEKFNSACEAAVFRYASNFQNTLERLGRWADYSNRYATMDTSYMESVWWVFKKLWELGLVYSDYRVTPYCPRCGTPLSNFEVNLGYKEVSDPSLFVKFALKDKEQIPVYLLAWTTTPWTLTANVALAINKGVNYVKALVTNANNQKEILILAEALLEKVLGSEAEILEVFKGEKLLGLAYEPLFNFISPEGKSHIVIGADFVTLTDGTGVVHTAGLFGADDMEACRKNNIAMVLTVDEAGKMVEAVTPWKGMFVKKADPEIINHLTDRGLIFKSETMAHSYPFCWRCDSPLLYYPIDSWYVAVTKIKQELLANNKETNWVPDHIKNGRFGKWLEDARDWSISRNRFWGAPLPIWKCDDCHDHQVVESLSQLSENKIVSNNKYYLMRHGEAQSNVLNIVSCYPEKIENDLTSTGVSDVERAGEQLLKQKIDVIFASPLLRTKRTAQIIASKIGAEVIFDDRLLEYNFGVFNGERVEVFEEWMGGQINKFSKAIDEGESLSSVRERLVTFIKELEEKYSNKNILIISHGDPLWALESALNGLDDKGAVALREVSYIAPGEWREVVWSNFPYDEKGLVNLHRPFIDEVVLNCRKCNGRSRRIEYVFDCWFESGSMPYASWHYPFQNKEKVEKMFPADFIAEGLDQTRGWFYTLHVLASALTLRDVGLGLNQPAFKNVIVNGLILAEDGKKLSKKLKNYTDPEVIFSQFGADALRFFLLSSTSIGEDYRFSDKGVGEVKAKVIDRLVNSFNFYRMYVSSLPLASDKLSILDKWVINRLSETILEMTKAMESYELTTATRALSNLLDDLSNWYIRRSRKRFQRPDDKEDYLSASSTLYQVLLETLKLMAPFSPFIPEALYLNLSEGKGKESLHLEDWPEPLLQNIDLDLLAKMRIAREVVAYGFAKREEHNMKVKQPLQSYTTNRLELKDELEILAIIADELNVKEVLVSEEVDATGVLDVVITDALKEEGLLREFIRTVQDMRQKGGFKPGEEVILYFNSEDDGLVRRNELELKKALSLAVVEYKSSDKVTIYSEWENNGIKTWVGLKSV